jgi:hypothetical protein
MIGVLKAAADTFGWTAAATLSKRVLSAQERGLVINPQGRDPSDGRLCDDGSWLRAV